MTWNTSVQRECYGTPVGIVESYDEKTKLYLVRHHEEEAGCITRGRYTSDELSRSLLLRLFSKAQQNKIEIILNLNQTKIMYYIIGVCMGVFSMYCWLA